VIGTSSASPSGGRRVQLTTIDLALERDAFLCTSIRHLSGALQEVVGSQGAAGFVSIAGQRTDEEISGAYKAALELGQLDRNDVRDVCIGLKRRIQGDLFEIEEDEDKIVFGDRARPCHFVPYLKCTPAADQSEGREYLRSG